MERKTLVVAGSLKVVLLYRIKADFLGRRWAGRLGSRGRDVMQWESGCGRPGALDECTSWVGSTSLGPRLFFAFLGDLADARGWKVSFNAKT
jgi:hypothetical protein